MLLEGGWYIRIKNTSRSIMKSTSVKPNDILALLPVCPIPLNPSIPKPREKRVTSPPLSDDHNFDGRALHLHSCEWRNRRHLVHSFSCDFQDRRQVPDPVHYSEASSEGDSPPGVQRGLMRISQSHGVHPWCPMRFPNLS